jgi:hypothetical protein
MQRPPNFGVTRLRRLTMVVFAGIIFILILVKEFLGNSQSLEYLHAHYPSLYSFLVSQDTIIVVAVVGLGLVLVVMWELLVNQESVPFHQPAKESAAAAKASIGDIHINVPVSTLPASPPTANSPAPARPMAKPKKRVVVFGSIKFEWLTIKVGGDQQLRGFEINGVKSTNGALLLPTYNDPTQSDVDVEDARAHIVFTDKDTGEKIIVPHAWWIGEHLERVHLPLGAQKYIIMIAADKDEGASALENTVRRDLGMRYEYNDKVINEYALHGLAYQVDVTLIHGGNSEFRESHSFEYHLEDLEKYF